MLRAHALEQPVEHRQQDLLLGLEVVSELPAAHAGALLDFRKGQALQAALGDDGRRRVHDLPAANAGDVDPRALSHRSGHNAISKKPERKRAY